MGTAGGVKNAAQYLDDTFLVISGDALTDFNLAQIIDFHKQHAAQATVTLTRVPDPLEFGVIMTDEDGHIVQFQEKPSWGEIISDTVNTGIYVLEPSVLDLIPADTAYDFATDLFPNMLMMGLPIFGNVVEGYWCDVGNFDEYRRATADALATAVCVLGPERAMTLLGKERGVGVRMVNDGQVVRFGREAAAIDIRR